MNEVESYAFATKGLIIVRDFYSQDIVDRMTRALDTTKEKSLYFKNDPEIFLDFMVHPWIITCCSKLIGPWFRFDHELAVSQTRESVPYLHGGQYGSQGSCAYHAVDKYSWNGQLTVGLCLSYQGDRCNYASERQGGFAYIPGSHHVQHGGQYGNQLGVWKEALDDDDICECPILNPGDLYVFSEALVHGQRQWCSDVPRKTLYIKYTPGYMAWQDYEITKGYLDIATKPVHTALFSRPYVREQAFDNPSFRKSIRSYINL